jgi:hypothetical protein
MWFCKRGWNSFQKLAWSSKYLNYSSMFRTCFPRLRFFFIRFASLFELFRSAEERERSTNFLRIFCCCNLQQVKFTYNRSNSTVQKKIGFESHLARSPHPQRKKGSKIQSAPRRSVQFKTVNLMLFYGLYSNTDALGQGESPPQRELNPWGETGGVESLRWDLRNK